MSAPVVTDQWAGNFECSGPCKRKRLMGEAFSKKAMERHLKQGSPLKCIQCIEQAQADERAAAAARRQQQQQQQDNIAASPADGPEPCRKCALCQESLPESAYNRNQWRGKPEGQSKCRSCVERMLQDEQAAQTDSQQQQLEQAQKAVDAAKTPQEKLAAESRLSALQAQRVTGLKPVKMSARGGRGRARGGRSGARGGRGSSGRTGSSSNRNSGRG